MQRPFVFDDTDQTIAVLNTGGAIVEYLSFKSDACPLIGTDIILTKQLGKGKNGTVFEVTLGSSTLVTEQTKRYVVKRTEPPMKFARLGFSSTATYEKLKTYIESQTGLPFEKVLRFSGLDIPSSIDTPINQTKLDIYIPEFMEGCSKKERWARFDGRGDTLTPLATSSVCLPIFTEFAISLLAGKLYREGTSINFLDTFHFAVCKGFAISVEGERRKAVNDTKQYTFMEMADGTLKGMLSNDTSVSSGADILSHMDEIVIQIIHAIGVYQQNYQIVHGDLHLDNIFLDVVTEESTYQGKKLVDVEFFEYVIGDRSIYIPRPKYIVKIGDFGLACKYSTPIVANVITMTNGYSQKDGTPWIPNWYSRAYDILLVTRELYAAVPRKTGWGRTPSSIIENIMEQIYHTTGSITLVAKVREMVSSKTGRPDMYGLEEKFSDLTPEKLLMNLEERYYQRPLSEKILVAGRY
jgi:serine/threonine protein kinase